MSKYYLLVDAAGNATEIKGETKIGRSKTNDLVLTDPLASRHHATVYLDGETLMIRDEQSVNGTIVNRGQIYDPVVLNDRDSIQFGDEVFTVRAPLTEAATILKPKKSAEEVSPPTLKEADQTPNLPPATEKPVEPEVITDHRSEVEKKKPSNRNMLIIAGAALVVLCICCIATVIILRTTGVLNLF